MNIEYKGLVAVVWYDDGRDHSNRGWYAEYRDGGGVYSDSMKVWEEQMPRRERAEKKAHAVALRALKREYRRRREKAVLRAGKQSGARFEAELREALGVIR